MYRFKGWRDHTVEGTEPDLSPDRLAHRYLEEAGLQVLVYARNTMQASSSIVVMRLHIVFG